MTRFPLRLAALLMCGTMLSACETVSTADTANLADTSAAVTTSDNTVASNLDSEIVRAQQLRAKGQFSDATQVLSQLMLVAPDDVRVVGEYGKVLAQQGRAQDAVAFLTRAIELSNKDYTLYSALGVAHDELGNQTAAKNDYEAALKLKPGNAIVLNNYALSRMLAGDTASARAMIAQARSADADNAQIARNVALVDKMASSAEASKPAPKPVAAADKPAATSGKAVQDASVEVSTIPAPKATQSPQPLNSQKSDAKSGTKTASNSIADSIPQLRQTADASLP